MAKQAYVEIEYLPSSNTLNYSSDQQNNVSMLDQLGVYKKGKGFKGLYTSGGRLIGNLEEGTLLNGAYKLFPDSGYPGWNGNELSSSTGDANGYPFNTPQRLTIESGNEQALTTITITFDPVAGEYATQWRFNTDSSVTIRNNSKYTMIVDVPSRLTSLTIEILKWSKPQAVCKITSVRIGYIGTYSSKELKEVDISNEDRPSANDVKFGLAGIEGNLKIYNIDDEFGQLNEKNLLVDRLDVHIYARNVGDDTTDNLEKVATLKSGIWKTDENSPLISLTLKDSLEDLKQKQLVGYPLTKRSGLEIFEKIFNDLSWAEGIDYVYTNLDGSYDAENATANTETKNILKTYQFPNHYGGFDNAWNLLEACCIVTMCRIYTNKEGIVCVKRLFGG